MRKVHLLVVTLFLAGSSNHQSSDVNDGATWRRLSSRREPAESRFYVPHPSARSATQQSSAENDGAT